MLEILRNLQQSAPVNFSLVAVNLDQKQPGFPEHILPEYLENLGVEYKIVEENTYGIVKEKFLKGKPPALCALVCAAAFCIAPRPSWARPKLRWAITATISCKRCSSICSTAAR
jgi:tRNA 2-thiocytidine biosynthesis protein TtcA